MAIKKKTINTILSLTILSVAALSSNAHASANHAFMDTGGLTSIPIGHYRFCSTRPEECETRTRGDVRVKLTQENWDDLLAINYTTNRLYASITDAELYGTEEYWTFPTHAGDCEDYVLEKRRLLMEKGWPPAALLITVVRQQNGEGHAVLTVRTDRGDLILDNLDNRVRLWSETPYTYLKRQSKNHTGKWESIYDGRVGFVGSINN